MSNKNRETLKQYFQTGKTPTAGQFVDLIDSAINQVDDSITSDLNGQIGVGNPAPSANLSVRGRLFTPLSGTLSVAKGATAVIGVGTGFDKEIAAGDAIRIGEQMFKIAGITDATHAELGAAATTKIVAATAYRDANLLLIENANGDTEFIIDKSGNVGIGIALPAARLHVAGKLLATELAGSGKEVTNLQAANLIGTIPLEQIPDLPAQKITGQFTPGQLPTTSGVIKGTLEKAITGTVSTTKKTNVVTGVGTLFTKELNPGDALKIGVEVFTVTSIKDDLHLELDREPSNEVATAAAAYRDDELMKIQSGNDVLRLAVDKSGTVTWPLSDGQTASVGTQAGLDSGKNVVLAAPTGYLHCTEDNEWSLRWEHDGQVTIRKLLKVGGDLLLEGSLNVGQPALSAPLSVKGNVSMPITGKVTVLKTSPVVEGTGTQFIKELQIGGAIQFDDSIYKVVSIEDATHLTIDKAPQADLTKVPARTNGPVVLITDSADSNQFSVDAAGNVVIGAAPRYTKLTVEGGVFATDLSGSGAGITKLKAANIEGTLSSAQIPALTPEQIPDLPASKVTGQMKPDQIPEISAANVKGPLNITQIPPIPVSNIAGQLSGDQIVSLPAEKITGQLSPAQLPPGQSGGTTGSSGIVKGTLWRAVSGTVSTTKTSNWITGAGTLFSKELKPGDALKIGVEVFTIISMMGDAHIHLDRNPAKDATAITAFSDDDLMQIQTRNDVLRLVVDKSGTVTWPLSNGQTAGIGTWLGENPGETIVIDAPIGYLQSNKDNQWCLLWEAGGLVAIRDLLKVYGNLDLRGSLWIGDPGSDLARGSLCVKGAPTPLTGTVTVSKTSPTVQGSGTKFVDELKPGYVIQFDNATYTVVSIQDATHLTINKAHYSDVADIHAQMNGPTVLMTDAAGSNQFSIDAGGDVAIGAAPRYAKLTVEGGVVAKDLVGSGAGITGISAANINGVLAPAQIPPLDASKISGQLSVDQIPNLPPSKVIGQVPGPGGRPLLASGNIGLGATGNIFQIPMPPDLAAEGPPPAGYDRVGYYSLEIYTTVWWSDLVPLAPPNEGGFQAFHSHVMTRTVLAGAAFPNSVEPMILSPTQTNHPEPKFPTVSFAIVNDNGQAWLQMQTTAGNSNNAVANDQPVFPVFYYIYSQL